jgi:Fe-S oxidoreductase
MLEFRAKLVEEGWSLPQHLSAIHSLRKEFNMVQRPRSERGLWAEGLKIRDISRGEKAEVVFHAGCKFSYDESLRKTVREGIRILQKSGVDVGILGREESCCGARAYGMGYRKEYKAFSSKLINAWAKAEAKTVVTSCAECYHGIKRLFPKGGSKVEVLHIVEYIDRLIKDGRITFSNPVPMTVTYHDPCHLGRMGEPYIPWKGVEKKIRNQVIVYEPRKPRYNGAWGVYDPPRDVLKSIPGLQLKEMERIREYAWCCGAGGGTLEAFPEFAEWTALERIEEAKSVEAEAIVSACPWCEKNFRVAAESIGDGIQTYDIVDLVSKAI